jgi:cytosolic iron-sulfur protein assembly protein CIAO1
VSWSPNDTKLASCSRDRNVWIWSYNQVSQDFECETILEGHEDDVKSVIWLDNDLIASASYDGTVRLWAEEDGDFAHFQTLEGHNGSTVWGLAFD